MRGTTPAWRQRARRPDSDLRQMIEAIAISRESLKKLAADFLAADSLTGLSVLPTPNDGVQLAEVATTILDHSSVSAGVYATQLNKGVAAFQCARLVLGDNNSGQVEISSITARLNPANGGTQQVAFWQIQLFSAIEQSGTGPFGTSTLAGIVPICDPLQVSAPTTEQDVTFSWAGKSPKPRPKVVHPPAGFGGSGGTPVLYVFIQGVKPDGSVAGNVGWTLETVANFVQNGDQLNLVALTQAQAPQSGFPGYPQPAQGSSWWTVQTSATQTPRLKLVYNTGVAATITWSGVGNKVDLGGTPTNVVEFTILGEVPAGSGLAANDGSQLVGADGKTPVNTGEVQADDATWIKFADGQTTDDLSAANPTHTISKRQTYAVRTRLLPSATSDATPTLRDLGARELVRTDYSDIAEVQGGEQSLDPVYLKCSIAQATLVALRDAVPDYMDAVTLLLANNAQRAIEFRVYSGCRALSRADWVLQHTFVLEDHVCPGPKFELSLISQLSRVRGQLPVYNVGTGLRVPLKYAGSTIAAAAADILDGQLALPARIRGPSPADQTVVGKLIPPNAQAVVSSYAMIKSSIIRNLLDQQSWQTVDAKVELDALAFLAGDCFIASQGRVKAVNLCEGSVLPHNIVVSQRDLTNVAWTKTSCTPALDQTGVDGIANAASSLLATGANATCLQAITDASRQRNQTAWVKRLVGSGLVQMTMDNGATWLTLPLTAGWQRFSLAPQTLANPTVGFRLVTNGDKIAVDLVDNDDGQSFQLNPEAIAVSLPADEIIWGTVSPGFSQAVPEYFVPWNWNQQAQRLDYEYRGFNGPAILNLSPGRIDAVQICPTEVSQWITSDGVDSAGKPTSSLAQRIAVRQATLLGGGLLSWDFITTYAWPELEEGDLIAVPTAYFVANNPITNAPISGWLMAVGKITGTALDGRRFRLWIRRWNDLIPSNTSSQRQQYANPILVALHAMVDEAGEAWVNAVCRDAKSIRIAASSVSMPTDTTARAAAAQVLDTNGDLSGFDTGINAGGSGVTLYVKAFAYENADGTGNESVAQTAQILFPPRRRAHAFDGGSGGGLFALAASETDGSTKKSTALNPQGTVLPVPVDATIFSYNGGGGTTGHMSLTISTAADYTLRRPDGSTVLAKATNAYDQPAAPTLSQVASGALGARTLFARVALAKRNPQNNATVIYRTSAESSFAVSANNVLQIASPAAVAGYDGWVALIGATTGTEVIQERGGGGGAADDGIIPFGTNFAAAEVTTSTTRTPYNSAMDSGFTIYERAQSTTYKGYLYFDQSVGTLGGVFRFAAGASGNWPTAGDEVAAQEQNADRMIALSFGPTISPATPAGGGTSSGVGSGGKFK